MLNKIFLLITVCFAFALPLHAYTDPGTGAMVWQLVFACFAGLLFYTRQIIDWAKSLFSKNQDSESES